MDNNGRALVRVRPDEVVGRVNRNIYGHFTEHIGSCVYGGLWAEKRFAGETVSGIRLDVLEMVRALRPPVDRWPGGCFSEYYHWEDGIGPVRERPVTFDWIWEKPEHNSVGTHEFMEFCRLAGCEPVIAANARTGSADEAAAWVSYCNSPAGTEQGRRRAANGAEEPFGVSYWDIGNEGWDMTAQGYAARAVEFARAMKAADPGIRLVAVGSCAGDMAWNEVVLRECGEVVDYIAPHHYTGFGDRDEDNEASFYDNVACAHAIENTLRGTVELVDRILPNRPDFGVSMDEWGVWWQHNPGYRHNYDVSDGLVAACVLNAMQRMSRRVTMANWAQLVNCLGMIQADALHCAATPVYQVFWLYSNLCLERAIETQVDCGTFPVDAKVGVGSDKPLLDAMATSDAGGGTIVVTLANRKRREATRCSVELDGRKPAWAEMWYLDAAGPFVLNTTAHPSNCRIVHRERVDTTGFDLPPHTVAALRIAV